MNDRFQSHIPGKNGKLPLQPKGRPLRPAFKPQRFLIDFVVADAPHDRDVPEGQKEFAFCQLVDLTDENNPVKMTPIKMPISPMIESPQMGQVRLDNIRKFFEQVGTLIYQRAILKLE